MSFKRIKLFLFSFAAMIFLMLPAILMAHPAVTLLDEDGNPVLNNLDCSDNVTAANGTVYCKGPAYSPKQTCGKCHDYSSVTKAYHFMTGAWGPDNSPDGSSKLSNDLWVSINKDNNTLQKYLTHAYAHFESPGQYGAW